MPDTKHADLTLAVAVGATKGKNVTHWRNDQTTWADVLGWVREPAATKEKAGSYVLGYLVPTPDVDHSKTGCPSPCQKIHRNRDAVKYREGIVLDVDHPVDDTFPQRVAELDVEALVHTTYSSTPDAPRYRIIIPADEKMQPETYARVADEVMRRLSRDGDPDDLFDRTANQASRLMYRPASPNAVDDFESWHFRGDLLDVAQVLAEAPERPDPEPASTEADMSAEVTEQERSKAESTMDKAVRCAPDLLNPDGCERGPKSPGRNEWVKEWATILLAFAKGGALDRQDVEDTLWEASLEAPDSGDGEWDRDELDDVCKSVWSYVVPTRPKGANAEDEFEPIEVEQDESADPLYEAWDISGDAHLAKRVALGLAKSKRPLAAWGKSGWAQWDGKRWDLWFPDDRVRRLVRDALLIIRRQELAAAEKELRKAMRDAEKLTDGESQRDAEKSAQAKFNARFKEVQRLRLAGTIDMAMKHMRSDISVRLEDFDGPKTRDWLNVANGMVNLRTGKLVDHDPDLRFTKVSRVAYKPDATHPDWDKALTAMPKEVARYMQIRFGQAASGHPPQDDVVPFLFGGGQNGKSTVFTGVTRALGEFYVPVPEKAMLRAAVQEHDALYMVFKGARLAVIEELPGDKWLDDERLKKIVGTDGMTGRFMRENYVHWDATHSLMVSSNHETRVAETDWGTWRRLARIAFPYTFDGSDPEHPADPTLREKVRLDSEVHEAALAWVVAGAVESYREPLTRAAMPEQVVRATDEWRATGNITIRFTDTFLVYDPTLAVLSSDVYEVYREWAKGIGVQPMSDQTFWERVVETPLFKSPGVEKTTQPVRLGNYEVRHASREVDKTKKHRVIRCLGFTEEGQESLYFWRVAH